MKLMFIVTSMIIVCNNIIASDEKQYADDFKKQAARCFVVTDKDDSRISILQEHHATWASRAFYMTVGSIILTSGALLGGKYTQQSIQPIKKPLLYGIGIVCGMLVTGCIHGLIHERKTVSLLNKKDEPDYCQVVTEIGQKDIYLHLRLVQITRSSLSISDNRDKIIMHDANMQTKFNELVKKNAFLHDLLNNHYTNSKIVLTCENDI
ncbi:MAG TPA: hypothetical protein VGW78_02460 [Candidatus Babeliales bacterium]|jgi:hypothetical protein|nr:hypothetical protein [Candidatus Babeliales bacterium]